MLIHSLKQQAIRLSVVTTVVLAAVLALAVGKSWTVRGQSGNVVSTVSAASFAPNAAVAPESIVAAFGTNLATKVEVATNQPLPTQLAGTTVKVNGQAAPLFFVSPDQINYLIPAGTPAGTASVVVTSGDGKVSQGTVQIAAAAPALFTANANGLGALASQLLRIKANGQFIYEPLAQYSDAEKRSVTRPIDFGDAADRLFLVLYLTGARQAPFGGLRVNLGGVDYAPSGVAAVPGFTGLDQINVELPRDFGGRGRITLFVRSAGYNTSNAGEFEIGAGTTSNMPTAPLQIAPLPTAPVTVGDEIEIGRSGFAANPRENTVQIVADDGVTTKADVVTVASGSLRIRIPFGAGTGQIKVRRGADEASAKIAVKTSISGFVEEPKQQPDGSVIRVPIPGVKVQLDGNPASERVVGADGSFVLPQPPIGKTRVVFILPSCNIPNCPSPVYSIAVFPNRDNQFERGIEITGVNNPLLPAQGDEQAALLNAPDATLTFLLPGRTPANLPASHFSTRIAQLTPFGVPISPATKITFPNADNIPTGAQPRLFKFDQTPNSPTLGQFIDIGAATVSADGQTVETAPNAITEGSYYFVSIPRATAAINGRVLESDGRPVPRAVVQTRGQSAFTDGFGGFVLRDVPVMNSSGDKVRVEVSYQRPNGRVSRKDSNEVKLTAGALATVRPEIVLDAVTTNFPPVILAPSSLTLQVGETRDFDFVATDPDSAQAPPVSLSGTAASFTTLSSQGQGAYRLRLATGANPAGSYTLSLRATDTAGATVTQDIAVTVNPNNNTPIAQAQSIVTLEDTAKPITLTGRDPGGRALSYVIITPPAHGCVIGSNPNLCLSGPLSTPNLIYTAARDYNGSDSFTFKVSNGSVESTTATVFIAVTPVNDKPVFCDPKFPDLCLPEELVVNAGESLSLVITASDVDAESALKFSMVGLPPEATLIPVSRISQLLSWTPKFTQAGSYTVTFTVTDNGLPPLSDQRMLRFRVVTKLAKSSGIEGGYIGPLLGVGEYIFAGTEGSGIFRSSDKGQSWLPVNAGITTLELLRCLESTA